MRQAPTSPARTLHYVYSLHYCLVHPSLLSSVLSTAARLMLLKRSHTRSLFSRNCLGALLSSSEKSQSNILTWSGRTRPHLNSLLHQPHLPPLHSSLNTDTLLPLCICTEAPLPGKNVSQTSLWAFPHVLHIFTQRSASQWGPLTTLVTQPPSLSPHTHTFLRTLSNL